MNVETNKLVGSYLKAVRKSAGLTQRQIAERCHVAQPFVSKLEMGERSLLFVELFVYSEALGIAPEELFVGARHFLLKSQDKWLQLDNAIGKSVPHKQPNRPINL